MDFNLTILIIITSVVVVIFIIIMLAQRTMIKKLTDAIEDKNRNINELTEDAGRKAFDMFQEFKGKELEQIRAEITKIAYGEANVSFEEWKVKWEKEIREDAIKRSREVTFGKITEHFLPFHPAFDFNPKDVRFIGSPIDMIVFEGIADELEEVNIHILEVKTGKSKLSQRQKVIKKAVIEKRVFWKELNFEELENAIKIDDIPAKNTENTTKSSELENIPNSNRIKSFQVKNNYQKLLIL